MPKIRVKKNINSNKDSAFNRLFLSLNKATEMKNLAFSVTRIRARFGHSSTLLVSRPLPTLRSTNLNLSLSLSLGVFASFNFG